MRIASSVACACPCPLWGCVDAVRRPQHLSGARIVGVRKRILWPCRARHGTYDAQTVLGERAGLVETYGVDAAQGFDGAGRADQRSVCRQAPGGGKLGEGGHQRQALRHGGHRNCDAVGDRLAQRRAAQQCQTGPPRRHRQASAEVPCWSALAAVPALRPPFRRRRPPKSRVARRCRLRWPRRSRGHVLRRSCLPSNSMLARSGVVDRDRLDLLVDRQRLTQ